MTLTERPCRDPEGGGGRPITFIGLSSNRLTSSVRRCRSSAPENSGRNIPPLIRTITLSGSITCGRRADLPDDLVYQLVKATFENERRVSSARKRDRPAERCERHLPAVPPGAIRYYRRSAPAFRTAGSHELRIGRANLLRCMSPLMALGRILLRRFAPYLCFRSRCRAFVVPWISTRSQTPWRRYGSLRVKASTAARFLASMTKCCRPAFAVVSDSVPAVTTSTAWSPDRDECGARGIFGPRRQNVLLVERVDDKQHARLHDTRA